MQFAQIESPKTELPAFFRFRRIDDDFLLTNQVGQYTFLTPDEFKAFAEGTLDPTSDAYQSLREKNFLRAEVDIDSMADRYLARRRFLAYGPNLHICVVTLRCNETCVYCHASRANMDQVQTDMSKETAEGMVDLVFDTTSPWLTIEFQGGEPLVNYEVLQHVIEYATEKNKTAGKSLEFTMVSNLSLMTEERLEYLLGHKVQICTSIDGPEHLHNKQRILPGDNAFDHATKWIKRINEAYGEMGLDTSLYHVKALLTTTKEALQYPKEIVDTYVELGCKALFLRPVDPFGFATKTGAKIGYPREEYLDFYETAVDYMLELNKGGTQILERYAGIFLTKILSGEDPNFLDIRNPAGTGIGALAYHYEGSIFTSDEGRMLHETGDDLFKIGEIGKTTYRELMMHPTVRATTFASNLDSSPDCVNCTYNPYCGISPEYNYSHQGSLTGRMRDSPWCMAHKGIQDYLFRQIRRADPETMKIFQRWTTIRPREHFVQDSES